MLKGKFFDQLTLNWFSDVNECTSGEAACHSNATCTNTLGSFTCTCKDGYSGNGTTCYGEAECQAENSAYFLKMGFSP